jgi:hypothetical protein
MANTNFVGYVDEGGRNRLINIGLVREVTLRDGRLELKFSETHKLYFEGVGIKEWMARLTEGAVSLNGEMFTACE